jgi:Na+/H+-dicarboxylate symporter
MLLWQKVLLGLALGVAVGLGLHYGLGPDTAKSITTTWVKPFGDAFVNLIRMLVVPLIFTSLVAGVVAMGDPRKIGSLGGRAMLIFFVTTFFSVAMGIGFATFLQPGSGIDPALVASADTSAIEGRLQAAASADQGLAARLLAIIPANPIEALAKADVLAIIFFAFILGAGILIARESGELLGRVFTSGSDVMLKVTEMVMALAPYGVFALITWVMATQGLGLLDNFALLAASLYGALLFIGLIVYGGLIKFVARLPLIPFYRGIADAMAVAFSTSSSNATLPVSMACATDNLGISRPVASSLLPLGATVNMNGSAAYLGIIAVFAAQILGIELSLTDMALIGLTATLAAIGTAGIPSASLFLAATVLGTFGVPPEQGILIIALIFPFDRLLDMGRTLINVSGDLTAATLIARWDGELDEKVYRAQDF